VPVSSEIPYSNNNNKQTYQDGYDSDGEIGPFFSMLETEVPAAASLPNFHLMTAAQLKEELRKHNLPVNG
jgi:hypothetical protein